MAGVHPDYQGQNIGFGIKQAQRVWALEHGYDEMRWTYDPLLRGNANFNLHRLGATAAIYHVNYYGRMEDEINILEDSDRLEVIWKLKSPRVKKLAAGNDSIVDDQPFSADEFALTIDKSGKPALNPNCALDAERFFVPIPRSISGFDLDTAQSWRLTLREMLQDAFERGYVAVDFVEQDSTCGYILHAPTPYYLYVARCQDDSLYTGITNNLHKRLQQHNSGKGAAYTRSRRPVTLLGAWKFRNRSQALQAEAAFKQQTRAAKLTRLDKGGQYRESINFLVEIT
jgi:predicted GNAT superfamily acetyltransferase